MKKIFLLGLMLWFTATATAVAEQVDDASAKAVMLDYTKAAKAWSAWRIAELMHPDALQRFRSTFDSAFLGNNADLARTELLPIFSVDNYQQFQNLSSRVAYQRLTERIGLSSPTLRDVMADAEFEISGEVVSGEDRIVVYQISVEVSGKMVTRDSMQRLRQHNGEWKLLLPPSSEETLAGIKKKYNTAPQSVSQAQDLRF